MATSPKKKRTPPTHLKTSIKEAQQMRAVQAPRPVDDQIDVEGAYFVLAGVEQNPEVFVTPKGKSMIDPNERKKTNSHQIRLRKPQLDQDNKIAMIENIETLYLPCRTDEWARENDYPLADVNRALYGSKSCYPHREAFFRMYSVTADLEDIQVSDEEEAREIINQRKQAVTDLDSAEQAMSKAGGKFVGRPGVERPQQPLINRTRLPLKPQPIVANPEVLERMNLKIEEEPA